MRHQSWDVPGVTWNGDRRSDWNRNGIEMHALELVLIVDWNRDRIN